MVPFVWKLGKTMKIFIELYRTKEIKTFLIDYIYNLFDCFLEIAEAILLPINHISPVHLKALYDCYYSYKNKIKKGRNYLYINLMVFFEKWLDIFVFIISILRVININFYIYIIRERYHIQFFSLLYDNEDFARDYSNKENRIKAIEALLIDIKMSSLMMVQFLLGILNPFFTLKLIKDFYLYFFTCKNQAQLDLEYRKEILS